MRGKIIAMAVAVLILLFSIGYVSQLAPKEPINLLGETPAEQPLQIFNYERTPVFSENLRFNHNNISFNIESNCSEKKSSAMKEAFDIFHNKMEIISFYEVTEDSDITVFCSDDIIKLGNNLFAAGEGGPSEIINTSGFKTITKGKIYLYKDPRCDRPVVEIHELLHVFGFDHVKNPKSLMYNVSACDQKITPDMIELINKLYSIKPLPDARISELSATKRGKYLDFNITVLNEGLIAIDNISLSLLSEGKQIDRMYLEGIGIGYGRTMRATNMGLPSSSVSTINFIIDYESAVEEINEDNNIVQMTVATV